ncbi:MAG: Na(+)/H(+) antiporter subunit C [Actinomycetaceae bacterium]|nr:Na(+)/H(+) antiporter subunit C [Actinomycetaceae bacterium]
MNSSLALVLLCGVLVAVGVYLTLERSLSRIVLGLACLANGINVLFLIAGGRSGEPAFVGQAAPDAMADPLVQAMVLTAIVISLGMTAFLLAMAYRSWQLRSNDEVRDDREDKQIARRDRARDEAEGTLGDTAEEFRDEVEES